MLHVLGVLLPYIFWLLMHFTSLSQLPEVNCPHFPLQCCSLTVIVCHQPWPIERPHQSADTAADGSTEFFSPYTVVPSDEFFFSVQADLHIVCSSVRFLFVTFILTKRLAKTRFSSIIPPPFPSFSPPVSPRLRSSPCANCPGVPTASLSLFSPLLHMFYESALWQCSSRSFNSYNVTVKRKMEIEMGFVALWIEPFLSQSRSKDWIICTLL